MVKSANQAENQKPNPAEGEQLAGGTYEIIRNRLQTHSGELRNRLEKLNKARKDVFGAIDSKLLTTERVTTNNNCVPRDMVAVGDKLLFGYNVQLGLRSETVLRDVLAVYRFEDQSFHEEGLSILEDERFLDDFRNLYRYYKKTTFVQFNVIGPSLFIIFRIGETADATKAFKWNIGEDGSLTYVDNRSDHELRDPPQHDFDWIRTTRDQHRFGEHPHISIDDRVFVEAVGGDLTIKVEDNTESGAGIYAESVEIVDQTLDDAEIYYAVVGHLIFLKIRPYQEESFRYIVYSEKVQQAKRVDSLEGACVLLPEDHGVIFADGYYLQTGEYKVFENGSEKMRFLKRVSSPNGEDTLYVFYDAETGTYVNLSYNIIEQRVETPIVCNGYSLFENGQLIFFRTQPDPTKHHAIQIWQTPYIGPNFNLETHSDSYLFKIGNRDIVRCMAACRHVFSLAAKDESYANIYVDIVREAGEVLDTYFWLDRKEVFVVKEPLEGIRHAATAAIDEFEKVVRIRKETNRQVKDTDGRVDKLILSIGSKRFEKIDEFVHDLSELRMLRGAIISLKDLRYVDLALVERLEKIVGEQSASLAGRCVEFLLTEKALSPYQKRVEELRESIDPVAKVSEAKVIEEQVGECGSELELLIDVVSNLRISDATQRTEIIDSISAIYATLNQLRSALKNKISKLASSEGRAEFSSQIKLLDQAVINYLDVCDTPEKVEEYLTKISVQISELEGRFSDFDDFVVELAGKRDEVYNTFESRKLQLVEARNKKTSGLLRSAERILSGMRNRVDKLDSVEAINGYFASDLMVDKVRDTILRLTELGDSVKADDVQARLKSLQQDSLRQLKDRKELFVEGENVIKFGEHRFSVNTQELALTIVERDEKQHLHLSGTKYFERIPDEQIEETRLVWNQQVVSESDAVYRGEYLAHRLFAQLSTGEKESKAKFQLSEEDAAVAQTREFMGPRYAEGYVKGVHDVDGTKICRALLELDDSIGLLRYSPNARALASVFWYQLSGRERELGISAKLKGIEALGRFFKKEPAHREYVSELEQLVVEFVEATGIPDKSEAARAAEYLYCVLSSGEKWAISEEASQIYEGLTQHLDRRNAAAEIRKPLAVMDSDPKGSLRLARDWVDAFCSERAIEVKEGHKIEVAALLMTDTYDRLHIVHAKTTKEISGMVGAHGVLNDGCYQLDYNEFTKRLDSYDSETVPLFKRHQELKKRLIREATEQLRLDEFKPRILSSFVRNKLIDSVYLPLIGDNLAKQMGVVGSNTRTDRMGMLLLISPPGYGKTTLMEYIANRLGIIFMKINGPAIGNKVGSLDPVEAPNAAARQELEKLNLSLEMGDNVMIYLDDIQHCNPEFLQKFISLCDAQRKIEGVYKGRTRTYDLRGRKVCVVMAGNPYSESGEAFKIPDMLANRADTYNLGDILGGTQQAFELSYIENALTSNTVLSKVATRNFKDIYGIVRAAEQGSAEGIEFDGNYSAEELTELIGVTDKLLRVRDVILRVNQEYIYSAAQADEYRTEPSFKLQGSYRNMNRMAEKIIPIMNDEELESLILDHYESESQTLTTGAEANLLKFKNMTERAGPEELERWENIKKTFGRNQLLGGAGGDDRMAQILVQLGQFSDGLSAIQSSIATGISQLTQEQGDAGAKVESKIEATIAEDTMDRIAKLISKMQIASLREKS